MTEAVETPELVIDPQITEVMKVFHLPEDLGFGRVLAPLMYRCDYADGIWQKGHLMPLAPISISPAAKILHYGHQVFEGLKAYKVANSEVQLFRPDMNAERLYRSAERIDMPGVSTAHFLEAVNAVVVHSDSCIPRESGQSLYLRPFIMGTEADLGLGRSNTYTFMVVASPSEIIQKGTMKVLIERERSRVATGGTGDVKLGSNYTAGIASARRAEQQGFNQSIWLDPVSSTQIEELSGMNFFALIGGELHTPELSGSILPGITRDSVIKLAEHMGFKVVELRMNIDDLIAQIAAGTCQEAFACGTAAIITPISEFGEYDGTRHPLPAPEGPVTERLKSALVDIQEGRASDVFNWMQSATD
ncbi:MAG: branched-chain amino acid aminotransferase [Pseudomonadales bacterium]|nr:branched-chain amino acid aminotransferase [Pseudomonadales bacterium]